MGVEAQHPVPHRLQPHAADPGRLGAGAPIIDRRQSQKAAGLIGIPRALRQSAELGGIKVSRINSPGRRPACSSGPICRPVKGGWHGLAGAGSEPAV